jgi:hypothetical protein
LDRKTPDLFENNGHRQPLRALTPENLIVRYAQSASLNPQNRTYVPL